LVEQKKSIIQRSISERNAKFFEAEAEKLDGWADDLKVALEREIKDIDRQIKEARRTTTLALNLEKNWRARNKSRRWNPYEMAKAGNFSMSRTKLTGAASS
jgi:hypothetical protein